MTDSLVDYPGMVREALLGVLRRVLGMAAEEGFPGEHHLFVGFRTDLEGVEMPDWLRESHPEEITVVLQHQYWDLDVEEEAFEVTLRFSGRRARLRVPFDAVRSFVDPAAEFGLRFEAPGEEDGAGAEGSEDPGAEGEPGKGDGGEEGAGDEEPVRVLPFDPSKKKG